jgi:hypothetical protein
MNRFMCCCSSRRSGYFIQLRLWLWLVVAAIFACGSAMAQKDTGALGGVVKDPSGAVIAGAKIKIADIERGTEHAATTNARRQSPVRLS